MPFIGGKKSATTATTTTTSSPQLILKETDPLPNGTAPGTVVFRTSEYTPPVVVGAPPVVAGSPSTISSQGSAHAITIPKPNGIASSELLVAVVHFQGGDADNPVTSPGWALGAHVNNSVLSAQRNTCLLWLAVPDASALSAVTGWTFTNGPGVVTSRYAATIFRVQGAHLTNPIAVAGGFTDSTSSNARTMPAITVPENDTLVVAEWHSQITTDIATYPATGLPSTNNVPGMSLVTELVTGPTTGTAGRTVFIVRAKTNVDQGSFSAGTASPATPNEWGTASTGGIVAAIRKAA